jgi:uncharacterized membrane protein HdeD (DUF308 family)
MRSPCEVTARLLTIPLNWDKFSRPIILRIEETDVTQFQTLIIRAILGVVFGVILSRFFYPQAPLVFIIGLVLVLVGLAYLVEYLRKRKKEH